MFKSVSPECGPDHLFEAQRRHLRPKFALVLIFISNRSLHDVGSVQQGSLLAERGPGADAGHVRCVTAGARAGLGRV